MSEKKVNPDCPCTRAECERHGDCDACRENHVSRGYLPFCERPKEEEPAHNS